MAVKRVAAALLVFAALYCGSAAAYCEDREGYTTMSNALWLGQKGSYAKDSYYAERTCNYDDNCEAFNSLGYYSLSQPYGYYVAYDTCTYVKTGDTKSAYGCQDYDGYVTLSNTNWQGAQGSQARSEEGAFYACEGDDSCTSFNSYGYYTITEPDAIGFHTYGGLCTYVKASYFDMKKK